MVRVMSRWLRLLSLLCILGAADVSGVIAMAVGGVDCGGVECDEGSAEEICAFDCGLCPLCPLRAAPETLLVVGETPVSAVAVAAQVVPLAKAVPAEVFRPPLA